MPTIIFNKGSLLTWIGSFRQLIVLNGINSILFRKKQEDITLINE